MLDELEIGVVEAAASPTPKYWAETGRFDGGFRESEEEDSAETLSGTAFVLAVFANTAASENDSDSNGGTYGGGLSSESACGELLS